MRGEAEQVQHGVRPGDVLADRYLLVDLLTESGEGRFWRAHDRVLARHVALHVVGADDPRAAALLEAARLSATIADRRLLRVLDAEERDGICFVVNEWGTGRSLDTVLATEGPMSPRRAAWVVQEAASGLAVAHAAGVPHGHLIPENLLIDRSGAVRLIGFSVDAALRGIAPTAAGDVRGLAGLLYAALTGRWPGPPPSQVPEAPHEGVMVLRPRRVRAGIPRSLDTLCDEVLNPAGTHLGGTHDAAGLAASLAEVVGDDSGMAAAEAARHRTAMETTSPGTGVRPLPAVPPARPRTEPVAAPVTAPTTGPVTGQASGAGHTPIDSPLAPAASLARQPEPEPARPPEPEPEPAAAHDASAERHDRSDAQQYDAHRSDAHRAATAQAPTEAGMPIFDEEVDEVDWLRHHTETPEPPPPFEDLPERPLFAPGPPDDSRTHRGRQEDPSRAGSGTFWPWEGSEGEPPGPPDLGADDPDAAGDGPVPGRRSLAVAVTLILVVLVGIGALVAYNAGRDGELLGSGVDPSPGATPEPGRSTAAPLEIAEVTDLDPQGDPPTEYPALAPLAADGDPTTAWRTNTYAQQFGPDGLKTGLGLLVDLGDFRDIRTVAVDVEGETDLAVYVADTRPDSVADLTRLAEASGSDVVEMTLDAPDTGRYVVVWIDQLPQVSDGFRAEIAEITVSG